jgi:hypothetical protein
MVKSPWGLQAADINCLGHCIFWGKAVRRVIKRERRVEEMTDAKSDGVKKLKTTLSPRRELKRGEEMMMFVDISLTAMKLPVMTDL